MSKSKHFSGQPIFAQLISLVPRQEVRRLASLHQSDRYYKKFKSYEHIVTMLYCIWSRCTSLREVSTGLMACERRILHLGMHYFPRKSTLADANQRRNADFFRDLYLSLYKRYARSLPDSRSENWHSKLFIIDATTISLFHDILKNAGRNPMNGKRKGGVKAHTMIQAEEDVPCFVKLTAAAAHDTPFMKQVQLPAGSIAVFDKGYWDYSQFLKWSKQQVWFVTRLRKNAVYKILKDHFVSKEESILGVNADQDIYLGHHSHENITRLHARLVHFTDPVSGKTFHFLTNNLQMKASTIADIYKRRWQIETLFKRIKQNYPLKYFLGDNENAIKIQIWCALIADLLLKYIKRSIKRNWAFANLSSMIRLHMMTYISLVKFLNNPEQSLSKQLGLQPNLFPT